MFANVATGTVNVMNNLIGTTSAGTTHLGVQASGINILRPGAVIRGNVLKGNDVGVRLQAAGFDVTGNTIGAVQAISSRAHSAMGSASSTFGPLQVVFPNAQVVSIHATATLIDSVSGLPSATSEYSQFFQVQTVPPPAALVVNSTADPGNGICDATECTLREAITTANGNSNQQSIDVISFAIPDTSGQAHKITLASPLLLIDEPMLIDGYTQAGATPNTDATGVGSNAVLKIEIAGGAFHFFELSSSAIGITLRGQHRWRVRR